MSRGARTIAGHDHVRRRHAGRDGRHRATFATTTGTTTDITVHTANGQRPHHPCLRAHGPAHRPAGPPAGRLHAADGLGQDSRRRAATTRSPTSTASSSPTPTGSASARGDLLRTWNGGVCCGPAVRQNVDDVTFLKQLVATISDQHRIDPDRVFATGHSNGMIMAYRLLCEAADVFVRGGRSGRDARRGQLSAVAAGVAPPHPRNGRHQPAARRWARQQLDHAGIDFPSPRVGIRTSRLRTAAPAGRRPRHTARSRPAPGARATAGPSSSFVTVDGCEPRLDGIHRSQHAGGPVPSTTYDSSRASWDFLAAPPATADGSATMHAPALRPPVSRRRARAPDPTAANPPMIGNTMKTQSCSNAQARGEDPTVAKLRAGFTDVLSIGMLMRCTSRRASDRSGWPRSRPASSCTLDADDHQHEEGGRSGSRR